MFITKQDDTSYRIVDQNDVVYFHVGSVSSPTYSSAAAASASVQTAQSSTGSYSPGDVLTTVGGSGVNPVESTWTVTHVKVMTAVVVSGGTGGTPGAVTLTGTSGTGTKFQATGTINGGGVLTGALVVSVAGDYTVKPTAIAAEPVTGGSLTGATVSVTLGVLTIALLTPGSVDTIHANPVSTTVAPAGGTGCTLNVTWTYSGADAADAGGFMEIPTATPASAAARGVAGSLCWDSGFLYVCVAADTWKRVAIATW